MAKFVLGKKPTNDAKPITQVMYRIPDRETQEALEKAMAYSGLSGQQVLDQMVKHCLRDAGFLK